MSAAVLVDQTVRWEGSGPKAKRTIVPPSEAVMKGVRDIVASVTGFSAERGDQITVETIPFEATLDGEPPPASMPKPAAGLNIKSSVVIGGIAVLAFIVVAGVFFMRRPAVPRAADTAPRAIGSAPWGKPGAENLPERNIESEGSRVRIEPEAMSHIALPAHNRKTEALLREARESVQKDPQGTADVLRAWMTATDQNRAS